MMPLAWPVACINPRTAISVLTLAASVTTANAAQATYISARAAPPSCTACWTARSLPGIYACDLVSRDADASFPFRTAPTFPGAQCTSDGMTLDYRRTGRARKNLAFAPEFRNEGLTCNS